jgi:hypothetical protein
MHGASPGEIVQRWLLNEYDVFQPFRAQAQSLFERRFADQQNDGFVAIRYHQHISESFRFNGTEEPEYDCRNERDRITLKFDGSGNVLGRALIALADVAIAPLGLVETAYTAFIIRSKHEIMIYRKAPKVSVGPNVTAAISDDQGARVV